MTGHDEGYERLTPWPREDAVRWWFWHSEDGFHIARGGLVRTCRLARAELRAARDRVALERQMHLSKPTHRLEDDGALTPIALDLMHDPGFLSSWRD